jgi:hypothetical protein
VFSPATWAGIGVTGLAITPVDDDDMKDIEDILR